MILVMACCKNYLYGPDTCYDHMPYNTQVFLNCVIIILPTIEKKKKKKARRRPQSFTAMVNPNPIITPVKNTIKQNKSLRQRIIYIYI